MRWPELPGDPPPRTSDEHVCLCQHRHDHQYAFRLLRSHVVNRWLVIIIVLLATTPRSEMHPASYVFGSDGLINGTGGWPTGLAFLFGLLSVQWTVRRPGCASISHLLFITDDCGCFGLLRAEEADRPYRTMTQRRTSQRRSGAQRMPRRRPSSWQLLGQVSSVGSLTSSWCFARGHCTCVSPLAPTLTS
jgi:hypothetical protein